MTDATSDADLVAQYIALQGARAHDAEESWPVEALRRIVPHEPERAWRILTSLIRVSPNELLSRIGVRELEEFVALHGAQFISEIEAQAQADERFRESLGDVWISKGAFPPEIERRLVAASDGAMAVLKND